MIPRKGARPRGGGGGKGRGTKEAEILLKFLKLKDTVPMAAKLEGGGRWGLGLIGMATSRDTFFAVSLRRTARRSRKETTINFRIGLFRRGAANNWNIPFTNHSQGSWSYGCIYLL